MMLYGYEPIFCNFYTDKTIITDQISIIIQIHKAGSRITYQIEVGQTILRKGNNSGKP